jgi:hypothetical protein
LCSAPFQRYGLSTTDIPSLSFLRNNGLLREDGATGPLSWTEWYGSAVVRPDQVPGPTIRTSHTPALSNLYPDVWFRRLLWCKLDRHYVGVPCSDPSPYHVCCL